MNKKIAIYGISPIRTYFRHSLSFQLEYDMLIMTMVMVIMMMIMEMVMMMMIDEEEGGRWKY